MNAPHTLNRRARRGTSWRASAGVIGVAIGLAGSVGLQVAGGEPESGVVAVTSAAQASAVCSGTAPLPPI